MFFNISHNDFHPTTVVENLLEGGKNFYIYSWNMGESYTGNVIYNNHVIMRICDGGFETSEIQWKEFAKDLQEFWHVAQENPLLIF